MFNGFMYNSYISFFFPLNFLLLALVIVAWLTQYIDISGIGSETNDMSIKKF